MIARIYIHTHTHTVYELYTFRLNKQINKLFKLNDEEKLQIKPKLSGKMFWSIL